MRSRMIAFLLGVIVFWSTPDSTNDPIIILFCVAVTLSIILILAYKARINSVKSLSNLFIFIIGFVISFQQHQFIRNEINLLPKHTDTAELTGVVKSKPHQYKNSISFELSLEQLNGRQFSNFWKPTIRLNWYFPKSELPAKGERWKFYVRLKPIHSYRNLHNVDYERWAFSKLIIAKGYVYTKIVPEKMKVQKNWLSEWKISIEHLANAEQLENKGLIQGLLIGDKSLLTTTERQSFRDSGLAHLLAISGLHVGMVAYFSFLFASWIWRQSKMLSIKIPAKDVGIVVSVIIATAYTLLSGWGIPAQRALVMLAIFSMNSLLRLKWSLLNTLLMSLVVMTALNPLLVLDSSSWLSFGAVFLISLLLRYESKNTRPVLDRFLQWIKYSFGIWLAMLPITLMIFGQIPLLGFIANIIAIPVMTFLVMPFLLLGAFIVEYNQWLSLMMWDFADLSLNIIIYISKNLAVGALALNFPIERGILLSLVIFMWLIPQALVTHFMRLMLTVLISFWLLISDSLIEVSGEAQLTVFDVGQGLAVFWEADDGNGDYTRILFDTGNGSSDYQVANSSWLPYFLHKGIENIDALIVSHNDSDHAGGISIFDNKINAKSIYSGQPLKSNLVSKSCHLGINEKYAKTKIVNLNIIPLGDIEYTKDNNTSCVILLEYGKAKILIPGDIESVVEQKLIYHNKLTEVDVVVAPHHGSRTSSSEKFVSIINANTVIFSNGYLNRFGFPKNDVVERYLSTNSTLFNTAHHGAIECIWDKTGQFNGCSGLRQSDWGKWHWKQR